MPDDALCDVLIVEDELVQAEDLADYLARSGLAVRVAFDGRAALNLALALRPRVVLLDYNIPGMTGVELATRLRPMLPNSAIVIMSGCIDGLSEEALAGLGVAAFVNKPLPPAALRQAILRLVRPSAPRPVPGARRGWLAAGLGGTR